MKKFKKYSLFSKKQDFHSLLKSYNALVLKYETLREDVKNNLYTKLYEKVFTDTEKLKHYEKENKEIRKKVKELKKLLYDNKN